MTIVALIVLMLLVLAVFGAPGRRPTSREGRDSVYQEELSQAMSDRPSLC